MATDLADKNKEQTAPSFLTRLKNWAATDSLQQHEDKVLLVLTLAIGATVGLVVVAFILVTENLGARMYPAGGAAWRRFLIPTLGALITGFLLHKYFPNARGSGVPQTKAALFIEDGYIRFRTVLGKFGCSSLSLASGIALGREGPSVQVGGGIASVLGRMLGFSRSRVKALVPAGAAAALAAAFNTPIAAVLFTLEEVMGDLHASVFGSVVLSSATSWIVLHLLLGDEPLFHVPPYQLIHPVEFGAYAVLGVIGGFVSVCFVKLLLWLRKHFLKMPRWSEWFQPVAGGLTVGLMGWFVPDVLGVGYSYVGQTLNGKIALGVMVLLVALKIVATATCYASGNAGGIFGPSLFIGAMMGGAVGGVVHHLLPDYTGGIGAYALVGMGTAFAGIIRLPMTSVIMIFEITRDYSIIVPLMISNLISFMISHRLQREPIYAALLHQDGIHLPEGGGYRGRLLLAMHAMRPAAQVFRAEDKLAERAPEAEADVRNAWPVVDKNGLRGMISAAQIAKAMNEGQGETTLAEILSAPDSQSLLTVESYPHVHKDHPLDTVLQRMSKTNLNVLPVVSRANLRELQGIVSLGDVMDAYGLGKGQTQDLEPATQQVGRRAPLLAGVAGIVLAVLILAGVLTYIYRVDRVTKARNYFQQGDELVERGRLEEAIQKYRNALSISHSSEHRLALGETLLKVGRLNEARIYYNELFQTDPDRGPVNLGLARIAAQQGRDQDAITHYRRAIYGSWSEQPEENRIQARFELVDLLGELGSRRQALTELAQLEEQVREDVEAQKRVARLFLDFGAAQEAADIFRSILRKIDRDGEVYAGLGEAEFTLEHYRAARDALRRALKLTPGDEAAQRRLEVSEEILSLDPTLRGLSAAERYRRSQRLVEGAHGALEQCASFDKESPPPEPLQNLLENARKAFSRRRRPQSYVDVTEKNIALAEELWTARENLCGPASESDEPLDRVLSRLSR